LSNFCIFSGLVESSRESIRYWCNHEQNKRKKLFTFGGDGNFNNYVPPDLVSLKCEEVTISKEINKRWTETGDHFGCDDLIGRIINSDKMYRPIF
jgi:hypothetical protein